MILLLVFTIISTILASSCGDSTPKYFYQGEIIEMVIINTNYSQVFNACDISQFIMCRIKYNVQNTDKTSIRLYYELFQTDNSKCSEKYEVCNGTCAPGNIDVCCNDVKHKPKFIRMTIVNLKEESSIILKSLSIEYQYTNYVSTIMGISFVIMMCMICVVPLGLLIVGILIFICVLPCIDCGCCCCEQKKRIDIWFKRVYNDLLIHIHGIITAKITTVD